MFLIETESRNTQANSEQNMAEMAIDGPSPHSPSEPCALAFPLPSHRDATTPSPCWAPHFMTREHIIFLNPTPSKLRLFPAATMSDDTPSALTLPLHCASILQPAPPPQVVAFESKTISARLLQFVSIVSPLLNLRNLIFEPVCVFYLFLFCLRNELQL